ncbi:uncharacterized protein KY384_008572 [Bacidia gigantensis]|uniref:uncharacterized protein n=1 Tax=Bacidia gigantensis TaxID=2732470 RepID=UPI001D037FDE|nr:uncharacterized protein KY384_008572 [Bacidia gigantensis]KAG8527143.1 hypothetical protein KY384_008572 [Bacidia gigantensis]
MIKSHAQSLPNEAPKSPSQTSVSVHEQSKPLSRHCQHCDAVGDLLHCVGCRAVRYCSKEHKRADWASHKKYCKPVRKARKKMAREEKKLRGTSGHMLGPANVFEEHVGNFWDIDSTRPYMLARSDLTFAIMEIKSYDAVLLALGHIEDMLRLCRSDNLGMRGWAPGLMLRLAKDQECYDFMKWWVTTGTRYDYDWGIPSLPFLDVKNANMLEPIDEFDELFPSLTWLVSLTLLKIKMLFAVKAAAYGIKILHENTKLPLELIYQVQSLVLHDSTRGHANSKARIEDVEKTLVSQLSTLYKAVAKANKYFWEALLEPDNLWDEKPEYQSAGSIEETMITLKESYAAWEETPGALAFVESIRNGTPW